MFIEIITSTHRKNHQIKLPNRNKIYNNKRDNSPIIKDSLNKHTIDSATKYMNTDNRKISIDISTLLTKHKCKYF